MNTLAERIKFHREKQGFFQHRLAKMCGLNQTVISKLECGTVKETSKVAELARALKVDAYWLATGRGIMELLPVNSFCPSCSKTKEGRLVARLVDEMESAKDRQGVVKIVDVIVKLVK